MLNERMVALGTQRSVIRELFEFGKLRAAEIGAENVFDFSIGNPSVPAPECVNETAMKLIKEMDPVILHGYTSAQGDAGARQMIADSLNKRFSTSYISPLVLLLLFVVVSTVFLAQMMSSSYLPHTSLNTRYLLKVLVLKCV